MNIGFHSYVESNEQTELTSKTERDSEVESGLTALGGRLRGGGTEPKGKGFLDMDNSVVIAGGQEATGNGKNIIKTLKNQTAKLQKLYNHIQ